MSNLGQADLRTSQVKSELKHYLGCTQMTSHILNSFYPLVRISREDEKLYIGVCDFIIRQFVSKISKFLFCLTIINVLIICSQAVDVRQELDLRIGAAFTRFQTMRLQKKFGELGQQLISYGSCQFPTLGFVVERYKAIESFVPENFWKIKGNFNENSCNYFAILIM